MSSFSDLAFERWMLELVTEYRKPEVYLRIYKKARALCAENARRRSTGSNVPHLDEEDLIQHVWTVLLRVGARNVSKNELLFYFFRRMENHFKDQCVKPEKTKYRMFSVEDSFERSPNGSNDADEFELSAGTASEFNAHASAHAQIVSLTDFRNSTYYHAQKSKFDQLRARAAQESLAAARLVDLIQDGVTTARQQASVLGIGLPDIHRLRQLLKRLAQALSDSETPKS